MFLGFIRRRLHRAVARETKARIERGLGRANHRGYTMDPLVPPSMKEIAEDHMEVAKAQLDSHKGYLSDARRSVKLYEDAVEQSLADLEAAQKFKAEADRFPESR